VRFAYAHKLSTYLMVFFSYFALALSGELGDLALLLAFVAVIVSWFWEPPRIRFERYARAWTVLSVWAAFSGHEDLFLAGLVIAHVYLIVGGEKRES
jgi:hypothetical protein